jgi:hypothetical protein
MRGVLAIAAVGLGMVLGLMPSAGRAQTTFEQMQRSQRLTIDANRNTLDSQYQDRYQQQLDLEKQFYDENRRRREDYRFQGNTAQRALENQLREDDLHYRQLDQANRERDEKQRQEQQQSIEDARRRAGLN